MGTTNSKSIVFFCTPNDIFCTAVLKNSNVRKIFCLYDSYVDLHVSVIFAAAPRVVMVYPSILGRGRDGGRDGGRDEYLLDDNQRRRLLSKNHFSF